jgi:predicted ribosome quality control (RQC) complex YloA/Tae2 family protein
LRKIEVIEGERILKIEIEKAQKVESSKAQKLESSKTQKVESSKDKGLETDIFYLFIEIFANGNVVLCNNDLTIINILKKIKSRERFLKVGEKYELPQSKELSVFKLDFDVLKRNLDDLSIVKFLAIKYGIGGRYSEEVCLNANVDKNKVSQELDQKELKSVLKSIENLVNEKLKPFVVMKNDDVEDYIPFLLKSYEGLELKEMKSYNDALITYYSNFLISEDSKVKELENKLKSLKNRIDKQEKQFLDCEKDYEKYNSLGSIVYENYQMIDDILKGINKAAKEKGWDYVLELAKSNEELKKVIKKIDKKKGEIIIELSKEK